MDPIFSDLTRPTVQGYIFISSQTSVYFIEYDISIAAIGVVEKSLR